MCSVAVVGWGVFYLLSPWLVSRRLGEFDPRLKIVPVSLSNEVEVSLPSSNIDHYGFRFLLPSREIDSTAEGDQMTFVHFRNGGLIFHNPLRDEGWMIVSEPVHSNKHAEKLLSYEMLQSKFKLMQAAMSVTPEQ
jgi:hypothetical protein